MEKETPSTDNGYFYYYSNTNYRPSDLEIPLKSPHLEPPSPSSVHSTACISHSPNGISTSEHNTPEIAPNPQVDSQNPKAHGQNVLLVEDNAINLKVC